MNTFRSRQAPVFSCSDGTEIKAGSDCRFIEITQNDKTYKVFASTMLACIVDNNDKDCPRIGGRGVAGTDKPYVLIKAHEATCDKRSAIVPVFLSVFPNSGESIKELEDKINSFVCACCNGGDNDGDWVRVAGEAVYNVTERIGIGTDSPQRDLDVVGDSRFSPDSNRVLEFGVIDVGSIATGVQSQGYRMALGASNGDEIEEIAIGEDSALGITSFYRKRVKATQGAVQNTYDIQIEADGMTLSAVSPTNQAAQVRLIPQGGVTLTYQDAGGADPVAVQVSENGVVVDFQSGSSKRLRFINLPVYPDNATALANGLVVEDVYRTATGEMRIVVTP